MEWKKVTEIKLVDDKNYIILHESTCSYTLAYYHEESNGFISMWDMHSVPLSPTHAIEIPEFIAPKNKSKGHKIK